MRRALSALAPVGHASEGMCDVKRFAYASLFILASIARAVADQSCAVQDPSGTPLNVRARPYGPIIGALNNDTRVRLLDMARDRDGKPWAYVVPSGPGRAGWVYREYIDCD